MRDFLDLGLRVWGLGLRVQGKGWFRVQVLGLRGYN